MKHLEILDSTLRDGSQSEGISFTTQDKLNVVKALDRFGISYIEAGMPGANPKDMEFFKLASGLKLHTAKLCAFGSTRHKDRAAEEDEKIQALLKADAPVAVIFGKASDVQVTEVLQTSLPHNLELVRDTLAYFKRKGREIFFDAEHFFDGYTDNPDYAMSVLSAALKGGANTLVLCDTNGGALPSQIQAVTKEVIKQFPGVKIGIHCHNDSGCAVANSILAVQAGAAQIQGTFIGFGERCGNADLSILIPNLQLKSGYCCITGDLQNLTRTALNIAEIANLSLSKERPYTGRSAFAHKGGMHVDGVSKHAGSFEHVNPAAVGNRRRILMSEMSGRTAVLNHLKDIAPHLTKTSPEIEQILEKLKELEHAGYQFEAAEASFELMIRRVLGRYHPHFSLIMYKTTGEYPPPDGGLSSSAIVQVEVDGKRETAGSLGNGPVHALDTALRRALTVFYPKLCEVRLTDYKVRVLETEHTTGSRVRVLIETADSKTVWTTVGVSTDIIEASWIALNDALEYTLQ